MIVFFVLIGYVLGLYFLKNNIVFSLIISLIFLIFVFIRFKKRKKIIIVAIYFSFLLGTVLPLMPTRVSAGSLSHVGLVVEARENYFIFLSGGEKFYVYEKENDREVGDYLEIKSEISDVYFTTYESQFSFEDYLLDKGVKRSLNSYDVNVKFSNPIRTKRITNKFLSNFDEETKALIDAFLFNRKDYNNHTIKLIDEMNLIFLLSMSGIYLSFLLMSLERLLKLFLKDQFAEIIPFVIFIPYSFFVFPKIGVMKVMSLTLLKYINKYAFKKRFSYLTAVSFLALIFLLIDYHLVYQSGFYVGFGLSLTLIFVRTAISKFKKWIQPLLIPLFIYVFMIPIATLSGGEFHIFGLLFQLVFIPFNEVFVVFSLISFHVQYPFKFILSNIGSVLKVVYHSFYQMDIALAIGDYFKYFIFAYYILYFLFLYYLESNRYVHLKRSYIPLVSTLVISFIPIRRYLVNAVYFINVGQGDSILIQNKDKIVMIDTGGNTSFDMASETLIPFMKKKQINHVDLLVTTHNDSDHAGAATSLMNNFDVKNYYKDRECFPVQIGDIYLDNLNTYDGKEENDTSLVFNVSFMDKKFLLTGDASIEVEKDMINKGMDLDCDILKVGHHGSNTSSCSEFLDVASPSEAIISCGAKNAYHHPSKEVIEEFTRRGIKIRYTKYEGTISYLQIA